VDLPLGSANPAILCIDFNLLTEAPTNLRRSSSSEDEMVARGFVYTESAAQSSLPAAEVFGS
jgi:hypothetical protein